LRSPFCSEERNDPLGKPVALNRELILSRILSAGVPPSGGSSYSFAGLNLSYRLKPELQRHTATPIKCVEFSVCAEFSDSVNIAARSDCINYRG
jgi:hypothetical protein